MSHRYNLLQMAAIPEVKYWDAGRGILGNLDMEYMGNAKFEFFAAPKAIANFVKDPEPKVFGKVTVELPVDPLRPAKGLRSTTVRYLVRESQEHQLIELLKNWQVAARSFEEWSVSLVNKGDFIFCLDEDHEAFMWNGKLGKRIILEHVKTSVDMLVNNRHVELNPSDVPDSDSPEEILRIKR